MKVLVCPDTHQDLTFLRYCISQLRDGEVDKVVYLGDSVDNWGAEKWYDDPEHSPFVVILQLAEWKKEFGDKFICLVGNHDWSYMRIHDMQFSEVLNAENISGHQYANARSIGSVFDENDGMFQLAACIDGIVYSHAGFTTTWLKQYIIHADFNNERPKSFMKIYNEQYIADVPKLIDRLNEDFRANKIRHEWLDHRSYDACGDHQTEGPLWVRPWALSNDSAFDFQIVGHTEFEDLKEFTDKKKTKKIVCIDSPTHNICITVIDGKIEDVHKITYDELTNEQP